ncbi:MAG: response regulator transcription factor [Chloroflexi bacterium]|nr:response regulator transcription factor [Chloroflexota bacterium]
MSILVSPSGRGNGRTPTVVHVFRDVTDRRHAERTAYEAIGALRSVLDKAGEEGRKETASPPPPPPTLTRRELEVLRLLADGLSTQVIGETLHISPVTARNHVTNALVKLGAKSRLQAVIYASQRQII